MRTIVSFFRDRHDEIYKVLLFLGCVAFIIYLFPKEGKFKYDFQNLKGKPWPYENLIAQFDFAINKSSTELEKDRADVSSKNKLYFRMNGDVRSRQVTAFADKSDVQHSSLTAQDIKVCTNILDTIFTKGILQSDAVIDGKSADFTVMLITDKNVEEERELGSFFTISSAAEYVRAKLASLPFGGAMSLLVEDVIAQNVKYDDALTKKVLKENMDEISLTKGGRMQGQSIISKGEIVTDEKFEILESLRAEYEVQTGGTSNYLFILLGQTIAILLCLSLLATFLLIFRKDIISDNPKIIFILLLIILIVAMTSVSLKYNFVNIYFLPFCILPVIVRAFYDTRLALFTHLVTTLIAGFMVPDHFEFVFIQMIGGIAAIFSIVNMSRRSQIFISSAIIFGAYCLAYGAVVLIQDAGLQDFSVEHLRAFGLSAALTLLSYPFIYLFERVFGFVSDVSLMELSDTNSPLLRELATKAPGTFQHSLQVADIAEEVVRSIGGNVLLIRTGALYHDIGKTDMPMYFVENQSTGYNPHEELGFEESAEIIIAHVLNGVEKAKANRIPDLVIDFIRTHHGSTTTGFFFRQYRIQHPEGTASEKDFQYPGPIPFSRETAVLMMADSVEASARALKKHDAETIDRHVENIIDGLISQNQFINSDITFRDITRIKKILKKKLMNIYHSRPEYPNG
jgi:putative nucleotidyltransferase with HDIG domain